LLRDAAHSPDRKLLQQRRCVTYNALRAVVYSVVVCDVELPRDRSVNVVGVTGCAWC